MKVTRLVNLFVIGLALTIAATGCRKRPTAMTPLPEHGRMGVGEYGSGQPIEPGPGQGDTGAAQPTMEDLSGLTPRPEILANETVHFAYDSSVVRSSEKGKVRAVADYMKSNPTHALRIEGHCDERGTDGYNMALGDRRALALREELIALGISPARIMTVSYGRSRPVDLGTSDEAHAKNRRGEFIVLTPP